MSTHHRFSLVLSMMSILMAIALLLAACGASTSSGASSTPLKNVSIGLSYNPDIQFAPFYVALSKGYYKAAGLSVTLNHGTVNTTFAALAAGKSTFAFAGGDELLGELNKHKDLQAIDVATIFQKYPVSLIVPADSPIKTLADLKGHTIGDPFKGGSTYIGLLALLHSAKIPLSDVNVEAIGFNQVAALTQHRVDAVMGYSNSQPLQIESSGMKVRTFDVSDYLPLISNGIITAQQTSRTQSGLVRGFVQATLRGLQDVINDPNHAVQISKQYVPGMNAPLALEVLKATIPIYRGDGHLGYNDGKIWQSMEQFLVSQKLDTPQGNLAQVYTNQYIQ
jgi:NitT/TauT family transport system substrate-binding protein